MSTPSTLYKQDFYAWTQEQAALLEARQWEVVDLPHLVEELITLGASERRALGSHLKQLVMHLRNPPACKELYRPCSPVAIVRRGSWPRMQPACPCPPSPKPVHGRWGRSEPKTSGLMPSVTSPQRDT